MPIIRISEGGDIVRKVGVLLDRLSDAPGDELLHIYLCVYWISQGQLWFIASDEVRGDISTYKDGHA